MEQSLLDDDVADVLVRLTQHKGRVIAEQIVAAALTYAGLSVRKQYTGDELASIADSLVSHGGLIELFGRTLRMAALRRGAKLKNVAL